MPTFEANGRQYEVDEDGFLQEPERWNESVATGLRRVPSTSTELTEGHWKVIRYIRDYYQAIRHRSDGAQGLQGDRI